MGDNWEVSQWFEVALSTNVSQVFEFSGQVVAKFEDHEASLVSLERHVRSLETQLAMLQKTVGSFVKDSLAFHYKLEMVENLNRSRTIRLLNFPKIRFLSSKELCTCI